MKSGCPEGGSKFQEPRASRPPCNREAEDPCSVNVFGIGSARRPDGPLQSGVVQGFNLILVSGVGEAVGGVSEAVSDEKIGRNGIEGTFHKEMTNDEMTFERHKHIIKPLSQTCDHIWRANVRSEKKCACVRTVRCCLYTHRRVHGSCHFLDTKQPEDYTWSPDSSELDNN